MGLGSVVVDVVVFIVVPSAVVVAAFFIEFLCNFVNWINYFNCVLGKQTPS